MVEVVLLVVVGVVVVLRVVGLLVVVVVVVVEVGSAKDRSMRSVKAVPATGEQPPKGSPCLNPDCNL